MQHYYFVNLIKTNINKVIFFTFTSIQTNWGRPLVYNVMLYNNKVMKYKYL